MFLLSYQLNLAAFIVYDLMKNIREYCAEKKFELQKTIAENDYKIKTLIIQVGDNPASNAYIKGKMKDCEEVGIACELAKFDSSISEKVLLSMIKNCNEDPTIAGFIVQLPLPSHISEKAVIEAISLKKDIDGFSPLAIVNPATPQGIITYLEDNNFDFTDKNAVIIGRSNIVGKPVARMLLDKNCNVRILHSKTSAVNKRIALAAADLIIVATGHRNTITDSDILLTSPDCLVIDVGMNRNENGKLCGDCENITLRETTPVPGGVGLLTRLALLNNIVKLYRMDAR